MYRLIRAQYDTLGFRADSVLFMNAQHAYNACLHPGEGTWHTLIYSVFLEEIKQKPLVLANYSEHPYIRYYVQKIRSIVEPLPTEEAMSVGAPFPYEFVIKTSFLSKNEGFRTDEEYHAVATVGDAARFITEAYRWNTQIDLYSVLPSGILNCRLNEGPYEYMLMSQLREGNRFIVAGLPRSEPQQGDPSENVLIEWVRAPPLLQND